MEKYKLGDEEACDQPCKQTVSNGNVRVSKLVATYSYGGLSDYFSTADGKMCGDIVEAYGPFEENTGTVEDP